MSKETGPSAGERLSALERSLVPAVQRVGELEMLMFNLSRENEILKDALQLLHDKQLAVISLANEGSALSDENINEKIVQLKELDLKNRLESLVTNGHIEASEQVTGNSFVVARELNKDGTVNNPRIQFMTARLIEEIQSKFLDKKVGDLIVGDEAGLDMEIMEVYSFIEQELAQESSEEVSEIQGEEESKEA